MHISIKISNPQGIQQSHSLDIDGLYSHTKVRKQKKNQRKKMLDMKEQKQLMLQIMDGKN